MFYCYNNYFPLTTQKSLLISQKTKEMYPTFGSYLVIYGITNVKVLFWANLFIVYDKWYNSKRNGMSPKKFLYYTKKSLWWKISLYFYASVVIGNVSCVKQGDNDSQYTFPFFFGICIRICHTIHTITKIL